MTEALRGKVTHTLTNSATGEAAYGIVVAVVAPVGGVAYAESVTVTAHNGHELGPETLADIGNALPHFIDEGAAHLAREAAKQTGTATLTFTKPDGTQVSHEVENATFGPGPDYVEGVYNELQRRRRSRVTDADYERVAQVYREAAANGESVQHAVKDAFTVSQSRAAAMIGEARRRGLLPPTTPGKATT